MDFGWQEIDKTLDLGYIRVAGLHRECKPAILFDPPNFRPRTMTHKRLEYMYTHTYVRMYVHVYKHTCVHVRMYVLTYVRMYIHTCVHTVQSA